MASRNYTRLPGRLLPRGLRGSGMFGGLIWLLLLPWVDRWVPGSRGPSAFLSRCRSWCDCCGLYGGLMEHLALSRLGVSQLCVRGVMAHRTNPRIVPTPGSGRPVPGLGSQPFTGGLGAGGHLVRFTGGRFYFGHWCHWCHFTWFTSLGVAFTGVTGVTSLGVASLRSLGVTSLGSHRWGLVVGSRFS